MRRLKVWQPTLIVVIVIVAVGAYCKTERKARPKTMVVYPQCYVWTDGYTQCRAPEYDI